MSLDLRKRRMLAANNVWNGRPDPSLNLVFGGASFLDSRITFTRATSAWRTNSLGTIEDVGSGNPRFDYDPATLQPRGLLIEEQRTNSIRNNEMAGAVAGTPGTLPANWTASGLGTLTREIVGLGTSGGIEYIDIRLSGTTSTTSYTLSFEGSNVIAATNGQSCTESAWLQVVGGSLTNITLVIYGLNQFDAGISYLGEATGGTQSGSVGAGVQRLTRTFTTNNASVAFVRPNVSIIFSSGVAIDITLRIGLPQLELGAFATSVIKTSGAAATRNADVATISTLAPWFNASEGTLFTEFISGINDLNVRVFSLRADSGNNIRLGYVNLSGTSHNFLEVTDGGVSQAFLPGGSGAANTKFKLAGAYKANDFARALDGSTVTTDSSGSIPSITAAFIGCDANNISVLNGWIKRIAYYPRRISNAQLQGLTA